MVRGIGIGLALLGLIVFTSCEDKKEADLYKAQLCIDKATAATVNACLNIIEGDNSKRANVMRCSAAFISEDIDETAIVTALENIDGEEGGNPTTPAIAALAMSDSTASNAAVSVCEATQSDSLIALAHFANIATAMKILLSIPDDATSEDIDALIAAYVATPLADGPSKEALGSAILSSQKSLCDSTSGLFKDDKACTDINGAITAGAGNANAVADALITNINTP